MIIIPSWTLHDFVGRVSEEVNKTYVGVPDDACSVLTQKGANVLSC